MSTATAPREELLATELLSLSRTLEMAGGISNTTRRRIADFPKPVILRRTRSGHPCQIAFVASEVRFWVARQISARGAVQPSQGKLAEPARA